MTHSLIAPWFPTDPIHRHEHFGRRTAGVLEVCGNQAVKDAFDAHIRIDRFKPYPIDGLVNFRVIHGGDRARVSGWDIIAVPADRDKRERMGNLRWVFDCYAGKDYLKFFC